MHRRFLAVPAWEWEGTAAAGAGAQGRWGGLGVVVVERPNQAIRKGIDFGQRWIWPLWAF